MKLKNKIRILTLLPLSIYLIYCCHHFITNEKSPTYLDCGVVISKSNNEVAIKHGSRTELYLNIKFKKSGFRSMVCNPTTYFSKNVGDNVCFNLNEKVSGWYILNSSIGLITLVILGLIILVWFITYLLPDSWKML